MNEKTIEIFEGNKLFLGRLIGFSKTLYVRENPNHKAVFNSNVYTLQDGKIWYGDLDLNKDEETLKNIANQLQRDLFILREMDGRFSNEEKTTEEIKNKSVYVIEYLKS